MLLGGHDHARFAPSFRSAVDPGGPPLHIRRIYDANSAWGAGELVKVPQAAAAGQVPIVSLKFGAAGAWRAVSTGAQNARLDRIIDECCALNLSAIPAVALAGWVGPRIAPHHEPEGDDLPADYNAMWKFLIQRYRQQLIDAGWDLAFIGMGSSFVRQAGGTWGNPWTVAQFDQALAGVDVDDVYADVYEKPGGGVFATPGAAMTNIEDPVRNAFAASAKYARDHDKNLAWPELGINRLQTESPAGAQSATFYDRLAAASYIDEVGFGVVYDKDPTDVGGSTGYTRISLFPNVMRSFAKLYAPGVVVPPDPTDPCAAVKTQLATAIVDRDAARAAFAEMTDRYNTVRPKADKYDALAAIFNA